MVSVVVISRNRRDELRRALRSVIDQTAQLEVIVVDDGSTDSTSEMVKAEFSAVRFHRTEQSLGYVTQRNSAARLATSSVILSLDDDALLSSPHVVEQTLAEFNSPRVGAVAIPCIDINGSRVLRQKAPDDKRIWVTDQYVGTAHAVRRDLFVGLGGYRENLIHQGEEADFCLRMFNAGYITRLGSADPIHHFESLKRDDRRMDFYGRRNDLLFAWHNVPMPYFPLHFFGTAINGLIYALRSRRLTQMVRGIFAGFGQCASRWRNRQPVSREIYRINRKLKKMGPLPLEEIEPFLPPIQPWLVNS